MNDRSPRRRPLVLLAAAFCVGTVIVALATPGGAVNTRTFVLDSSADLAAGVLDRVSVTSDGQVVIGRDVQRLVPEPSAQTIWSILDLGDGTALAGGGVDGRIYRVDANHATLYAETGGVMVTSLARGDDGTVYAATIPDGKIFRVRPPQGGHIQAPELLVQLPGAQHVWAIAWHHAQHVLLAATGPEGKLFAVDAAGHAAVWFDSDEPHLYSLMLGGDGTAYVGTGGGHALVYAVRGAGQTRAVGRFTGDEVKAIAVAGDTLYIAANEFPEPPEPARRVSATPSRVPSPGGPGGSRPRAGHGSVYRVRASDGMTERVYTNADAHVTALEWIERDHEVLAGLGVNGRIMAIGADRTVRTAFDVDENQVQSLDLAGSARLFGTGDTGVLYRVGASAPVGATWVSKVLDATTASRWGAVQWRGTGALDWESRSGNADPPDATWSAWQPLTHEGSATSPPARYLQVRARWSRDPATALRAVTVYYLPSNQRAALTEVTAETKTGDPRPLAVKIGWKVDNPDADALRYRIRFRGDQEQNWRSALRIGEYVTGTSFDWPVEGLPEGYYRVQVEASDEAANPEPEVQRDIRMSEPVLVDNTPPRVSVHVANGRVEGDATDVGSAVTRVEVSVDTQDWRPVRARDGILDSRTEAFETPLPTIADGGEHVVTVRAYDEAGNVGSASATFRGTRR